MSKIYVGRIEKGLMTLDDVPLLWRGAVRELMEKA